MPKSWLITRVLGSVKIHIYMRSFFFFFFFRHRHLLTPLPAWSYVNVLFYAHATCYTHDDLFSVFSFKSIHEVFGLKSINQAVAWLFEAQCLSDVFMLIGAAFTLYPYTCKSSSSDSDEGEANSDNRPPALNFSVFHPYFFFFFFLLNLIMNLALSMLCIWLQRSCEIGWGCLNLKSWLPGDEVFHWQQDDDDDDDYDDDDDTAMMKANCYFILYNYLWCFAVAAERPLCLKKWVSCEKNEETLFWSEKRSFSLYSKVTKAQKSDFFFFFFFFTFYFLF